MAESTGPILAIGAITFANRSIIHSAPVDWKVPLSTGLVALLFAAGERISAPFFVGVAWIGVVATLITPAGGFDAPLVSLAKIAGVDPRTYGIPAQPNGGGPVTPTGTRLPPTRISST